MSDHLLRPIICIINHAYLPLFGLCCWCFEWHGYLLQKQLFRNFWLAVGVPAVMYTSLCGDILNTRCLTADWSRVALNGDIQHFFHHQGHISQSCIYCGESVQVVLICVLGPQAVPNNSNNTVIWARVGSSKLQPELTCSRKHHVVEYFSNGIWYYTVF